MTKFNLSYYHPSHFEDRYDAAIRTLMFFAYAGGFLFLGILVSHFLNNPVF